MNSNTIPLQDVIPWSPNTPRNILVCDSVETDGSFVLSTMAAHLFSSTLPSSSGMQTKGIDRQQISWSRALWLCGNASTKRQVASALKKLGCDAGAAYLRNDNKHVNNSHNGLKIRSLALEIADRILASNNSEDSKDGCDFDRDLYLKTVFNDVKAWADNIPDNKSESVSSWIIVDDVTALASILGDRLVYCFIERLISLAKASGTLSTQKCGVIIRCSGDLDQMLYRIESNERKDHSGWFGTGGLSHKQAIHDKLYRTFVPWERAVEESVDAIIDVLPLLSGFSREAHGRLIFSETPNGRGWKNFHSRSSNPPHNRTKSTDWNKLIFNFRIQDNGARAIRLRAR
jgi:hypothetical protein